MTTCNTFISIRTTVMLAILLSGLWTGSLSQRLAAEDWPSVEEARAIGDEGFIHGLPIVMNYSVMYEFAIDQNSSQY